MTGLSQFAIERLAYVGLTTQDVAGLSDFFERALGFRLLSAGWKSALEIGEQTGSASGAYRVTLGLGDEVVELLQFDRPGRPYPDAASASDLCFQHFAIVVSNMELAYQRLCSVGRWSAISTDGPQRLPAASGGVTAFKFRDPEGHPLQLLAFAPGHWPDHWKVKSKSEVFLGIDHSAISVQDSARSIDFYAGLGLRIGARSHNGGYEQQRLDGVVKPQLEVTALEPRHPTPHLQLLHYRSAVSDQKLALRNIDVAATRLVFEAAQPGPEPARGRQAMIDPDGHHVRIVASPDSSAAWRAGAYAKTVSDPVSANSELPR